MTMRATAHALCALCCSPTGAVRHASKISRPTSDRSGIMNTVNKLLLPICKKSDKVTTNKVTVAGCGMVGMATVFSLLAQKITNNVAFVDVSEGKVKGERMDLLHGSPFLKSPKINASTDFSVSRGSHVIIVTAGVRQKKGETRLDIVQRNFTVMKKIIPKLKQYSPDAIFLLASNPCDVLTYVTWKISGLPKHKVIGSGTNLDSARFRYLLSRKLGIAPKSCHAYIIGEHGLSAVPVWSSVNIAGVRLTDINPEIGTPGDKEKWIDIYKYILTSPAEVRSLKGCTNWAISLSLSQLTASILQDSLRVHPVSTNIKGLHGIDEDVFLSVPCVLGVHGIYDIVRQPLTDTETKMLQDSAKTLLKVQNDIKW